MSNIPTLRFGQQVPQMSHNTHFSAANFTLFRCKNGVRPDETSSRSTPQKLGLALLGSRYDHIPRLIYHLLDQALH
jgi:hypothetical protein